MKNKKIITRQFWKNINGKNQNNSSSRLLGNDNQWINEIIKANIEHTEGLKYSLK